MKELGDGFKEIIFGISDVIEVQEEDAILLMIDLEADIEPNHCSRIAGRFYNEGIFLLKPNQRIGITMVGKTQEFAAIQFEKKMYLIKLHNN